MKRLRLRPTRTVILAGAVTLALGGGSAVAAATVLSDPSPVSSTGIIDGCWTNTAVRGSHVIVLQNQGTTCPKGTTPISWNESGPAGPTGPAGPSGPSGPAGASGASGSPGTGATVAALATGNANCPNGGTQITDGSGDVAYACNGANGPAGTADLDTGYVTLDIVNSTCTLDSADGPDAASLTVTYVSYYTLLAGCEIEGFAEDVTVMASVTDADIPDGNQAGPLPIFVDSGGTEADLDVSPVNDEIAYGSVTFAFLAVPR
jgi:hypothetical protein